MYEILIYTDKNQKSDIKDYISELKNAKDKDSRIKYTKIMAYIDLLSEKGLLLGDTYIKHISKEIWELRPIKDRILFATYRDNKFILLSIFRKETRRTPRREIEKAKKLLKEFKGRW